MTKLVFVSALLATLSIVRCHPINEGKTDTATNGQNNVDRSALNVPLHCGNIEMEQEDQFLVNNLNRVLTNKQEFTYTLLNDSEKLQTHLVKAVLVEVFDIWGYAANLTFTYTNDTEADIKVSFEKGDHGDDNSFDGPSGIVGHVLKSKRLLHFDDSENWVMGRPRDGQVDFYSTALHEAGHILGLDHLFDYDSVMYPLVVYSKYQLHDTDIREIKRLYNLP